MSQDVRKLLNDFTEGLENFSGQEASKDAVGAFMGLLNTTYADAALDTKTKELISVAIACYSRCVYCIVYHTYQALAAGAKRDEILQAAMVSVAFGGGPSMAYSVSYLKDSLDEFEKDFK
jgi:AhpD family alkylhydroperoxidase